MPELTWYYLVGLVALVEGGEFGVLFSGFIYRLESLHLVPLFFTLFAAYLTNDLIVYRLGTYLYKLPIIRKIDSHLTRLDARIQKQPFIVAFLARFSYGTHRFTVARYRQNGVSLARMTTISIVTLLPWLFIVSGVVYALFATMPVAGRIFRFAEFSIALGFIIFIVLEIRASAELRKVLHTVYERLNITTLLFQSSTRFRSVPYIVVLTCCFLLLIATPILVKDGVSIFTQEMVEAVLITLMLGLGFLIVRAYQRQLRFIENRYIDMSKHIGSLNLQTVQISSMFSKLTHLPESKRDVRIIMESINSSILSAVNVPWVLTRIVDVSTGRTLTEQVSMRESSDKPQIPKIANLALIGKERPRGYYVYRSDQQNTYVRATCALETRALNPHQEMVVRAAVNNLALLYLIFTSNVISATQDDKQISTR